MRERIIEGAAELFKTYGIRSVTMDSIAGHLGMSKRTIYEVFSDKDELLMAVLQRMSEKQKEVFARTLNSSENAIVAIFKLLEMSNDHIQSMSPAFRADIKKYHTELLMNSSEKLEMPDHRSNKAVIERGIKEKLFRKEINPEIVNSCLYSIGRSIMDNDLYSFEDYSRKEVIKNTFLNYMRGISTKEGVDLINKLEIKF